MYTRACEREQGLRIMFAALPDEVVELVSRYAYKPPRRLYFYCDIEIGAGSFSRIERDFGGLSEYLFSVPGWLCGAGRTIRVPVEGRAGDPVYVGSDGLTTSPADAAHAHVGNAVDACMPTELWATCRRQWGQRLVSPVVELRQTTRFVEKPGCLSVVLYVA